MTKLALYSLLKNKILNSCRGRMSKIIFTIVLAFSFTYTAYAQKPKKLGTVNEFRNAITTKANAKTSNERSLQTTDATLSTLINVTTTVNGSEVFIGEVKGSKASNVFFIISNGTLEGKAVLPKEEKAYSYTTDAQGNVVVTRVNIHDVVCIDFDERANTLALEAVPPTSSTVYKLQSLPGVVAVAYLDFDGEYVSGTRWNGGNPIDAVPGNFTETDITNIWKMISEDFRPFNLNITTDLAVFNAAPVNRRMRCIFTPTNTAAPGAGGVAYLNSFSWNNDTPCWVFNGGVKAAGETGSHELGHTFNLSHDGRTTPSEGYFAGHGDWAPIMGVGFYENISQWSKGEYAFANQTQDDIAIISNTINGFGFRADDAGNSIATAKALTIGSTGTVNGSQNYGIVTQRTDVDVYSFTTSGGAVSLTVNPSPSYPDLDILLTLTNSSGTILATANPAGLAASVSATLAAGTYYMNVDGIGVGDPATDGYSDYASLGEYNISGTVPAQTISLRIPENPTSTVNGLDYKYYEGNWSVLPNFSSLTPVKTGTVTNYDLTVRNRNDQFGFSFTGFVNAPADGQYTFYTTSDDGSNLYIGSTLVVNNDGLHGAIEKSGTIGLRAGKHAVTVTFFEQGGGELLTVSYAGPGIVKQAVPASALFRIPLVNNNPAVSITSPVNNASFTAIASITINANASDSDGSVTKVEFFNGSTKLGEDLSSPYSFIWSNVAAGTYQLTAKATDNNAATGTSAIVTINVTQPTVNTLPSVSITSPVNNASFTAIASVTINANASDSDGSVTKVEFFNGSTKLGEDLSSPYSFVWSNVAAGTYQLTAKATDNSAATSASAIVTINVTQPTVNTLPSASISSPTNGQSFTTGTNLTVAANASDADGSVTKVDFFNGTTLIGSDVSAPYSVLISNIAAGTYNLKAVATDNAGAQGSSSVVTITVTNPNTTIGINGPSCVNVGQAYLFTLNAEAGFTSGGWWTTGQATVQVDPADSRKVYVTYDYPGSFILTAGANYNVAPWYKSYDKAIQVGGCAANFASAASVVAAPHPFIDQTSVSVDNGEKVLSVKIFDLHGKEILNSGNVDIDKIMIGENLNAGIYIIHVVTESGSFVKNIIKTE